MPVKRRFELVYQSMIVLTGGHSSEVPKHCQVP